MAGARSDVGVTTFDALGLKALIHSDKSSRRHCDDWRNVLLFGTLGRRVGL
jgi:hypothetical protein